MNSIGSRSWRRFWIILRRIRGRLRASVGRSRTNLICRYSPLKHLASQAKLWKLTAQLGIHRLWGQVRYRIASITRRCTTFRCGVRFRPESCTWIARSRTSTTWKMSTTGGTFATCSGKIANYSRLILSPLLVLPVQATLEIKCIFLWRRTLTFRRNHKKLKMLRMGMRSTWPSRNYRKRRTNINDSSQSEKVPWAKTPKNYRLRNVPRVNW